MIPFSDIYKIKLGFWTYYFMGETYKGFKTENWYTVINGLGMGYLVGKGLKAGINSLLKGALEIIGFAHTHPIGHSNKPSGPDAWMKRIGFIVGPRIFPIAVRASFREHGRLRYYASINYF